MIVFLNRGKSLRITKTGEGVRIRKSKEFLGIVQAGQEFGVGFCSVPPDPTENKPTCIDHDTFFIGL